MGPPTNSFKMQAMFFCQGFERGSIGCFRQTDVISLAGDWIVCACIGVLCVPLYCMYAQLTVCGSSKLVWIVK